VIRVWLAIHNHPNVALAVGLLVAGLLVFKCQERFAPDPFGRLK
jgi:hypothetical protein